jgi:hypothetical protein
VSLQLKLDYENLSKHVGLALQNGFDLALLHSLLKLLKGTSMRNYCQKRV